MKQLGYLKNSKGLTIIELVIVTAILGIAAELVAHNVISQMPKYRIQGAARRIALDFMEARSRAINQSVDVVITFDADPRLYNVEVDRDFDETPDSLVVAQDIRDDFPGVLVSVSPDPLLLEFNPRGFANTNATITLTTNSTSGVSEKKIEVSLAGMVRVD